jgi:8-amino-3,8-dideoxy-alpha-D-manno-octulosonate transaminase
MFPGGLRLDEREEQAAVEAVRDVMRSKRLFRYYGVSPNPLERSRVRRLEASFARRVGADHALAVNSGTSALVCGLAGVGVGPGDEVIVPAYTWVSTASSVLAVGAVPVVAEVDESLTIDPADVERKISPHTRAIIAVHMRGAPARMDRLLELARDRRLALVEDVAQAVGGAFRGRPLGSIGDVGAYSFQMSKILTAGEGGMVTTSDPGIHRRCAMFHDAAAGPELGVPSEDWLVGLNLRMSELHAAVLLVQLDRLDGLVESARAHKRRLEQLAGERLRANGVSLRAVTDPDGDTSIALIFFLPEGSRTKRVVSALADENIPASRLYHDLENLPSDYVDVHAYPAWTPLLRKRTWSARGGPWRWHAREIAYPEDACPTTVDLLRRAVHIDVSPELSDEQVEQMGAGIAEVVERLV